jgi:uncharacterized protein (TIGR03000 family)
MVAPPQSNIPAPEQKPAPKRGTSDNGTGGGTVSLDRAKVIVNLPEDAKLYIDGRLMKTASAHRVFSTPTLEPGQLYYYELRAEVSRDGKTVSQEKRVIVAAGQQVEAAFNNIGSTATAKADATYGR